MSGGKTIASSDTRIEAISLQSSAMGVPFQVLYGVNRVKGNLAWYGGFKATPHTSTTSAGGKGGGTKTSNTTFTYSASLLMGLCEGPIAGIPRVWKGKQLFSGDATQGQVSSSTETYTPPGSGAMTYTTAHAAALLSVSYITAPYTYNYELESGVGTSTSDQPLAPGTDYTVAAGVVTILNPAYRGVLLSIRYQWANSTVTHTALAQLGLTFGAGSLGQAVWSPLSTIAPAQAIGYSGLAYVAGQDYLLGDGAQVENHTFEVLGQLAYSVNNGTVNVPDCNPATAAFDLITNGRYGANFPAAQLAGVTEWATYCLAGNLLASPLLDTQMQAGEFLSQVAQLTNTAPVWSNGRLKMIPYGDVAMTANGATFTPNVTPVWDLVDSDFTPGDGEAPVTVIRKAQADAYNSVKVEFCNRANLYNVEIAEAKDSANIDAFGLRVMDTVVAHWICDAAIARQVAQLVLQRALYVRNTFRFSLSWAKVFLEPMDLVTLTDAGLGLVKLPVRITSAEESEDSDLNFEAEDFPLGIAHAALYGAQSSAGFQHDYNAAPGNAYAPVIFEGPGALCTTGLELCVATAGGANWGGCEVWASYDGTNYARMGVIHGGSRYGSLTAAISGGNLPVALLNGQMISSSALDVAANGTLCYIAGANPEFLSYQTASLTGPGAYTLSALSRGQYGTAPTPAHATADRFVRIDDSIAISEALDPALIGKTVSIKLLSFNVYGGAQQGLGDVSPTTYVITGQFIGGNSSYTQADLVLLNGANMTLLGNTAYKSGGSDGVWDASVYSRDGFTGGAFCSGVAAQANKAFMIGLNTDPTTDSNFSSLDYAWGCSATGTLGISESNVDAGVSFAYAANDVLAITYDGTNIRYLQNGTVRRTLPVAAGLRLYLDTSFANTGARLTNIQFGPLTSNTWAAIGGVAKPADYATADITLLPQAAGGSGAVIVLTGNSFVRTDAGGAFNAGVYSAQGYTGGAFAEFSSADSSGGIVLGLNTDPLTDSDYSSIDYGIYAESSGTLYAAESGSFTNIGTWSSVADVFAVRYDGANIRYEKNGTVLRTVSVTAAIKFYLDSSVYSVNRGARNIRFGPYGNPSAVSPTNQITTGTVTTFVGTGAMGTSQLGTGAATEIAQDYYDFAGLSVGTSSQRTYSFTPAVACTIEFTAKLGADGINHDAGNQVKWQVTPSGGSTTILGYCFSNSTTKSEFICATSLAAAAGVALSFEIYSTKVGGTMHLFESYMRVTAIKR